MDMCFCRDHQLAQGQAPRYLTEWAFLQGTEMMSQYLALGIELKLFASEELPFVYYYWETVLSMKLHVLKSMKDAKERLRRLKAEDRARDADAARKQAEELKEQVAKAAKSAKRKKGPKKAVETARSALKALEEAHADAADTARKATALAHAAATETGEDPSLSHLALTDHLTTQLRGLMAKGVFTLLCGVRKANEEADEAAGTQPSSDAVLLRHTIEHRRFTHRFRAFVPLPQPPPLKYSDYAAHAANEGRPAAHLFAMAREAFAQCKNLAERIIKQIGPKLNAEEDREYRALAKSAVANSIQLVKYGMATGGEERRHVEVELTWMAHAHIPVCGLGVVVPAAGVAG